MAYRFIKRLFDVVIILIGCVFLIPLYIIIRIAYLFTGDFHKIIYVQPRIGKNGKIFNIYKFRTMEHNAEEHLKELLDKNPKLKEEYTRNKKLEKDPRITKVGRFVRRFSIDETPQFINVFIGQMSVIGNRPYLTYEKRDMGKYYENIVKTKPGITGIWQISGHNNVPFKSRLVLEAQYSEQACLSIDAHIFFRTFSTLLMGGGGKKLWNL